ncbi:MAG TPA: hypothetical protein VK666_13755 [Chryseolinea sp.]|nr:hypothetical protein [Chryseolinea sp.]
MNTNCTYQTLSFDDRFGYILFCERCRRLQLGLGCAQLQFDEFEFGSFCETIREIYKDPVSKVSSGKVTILLSSSFPSISLHLSTPELEILHLMIEEADTTLTTNSMIRLFSQH